MKIRIALFLIIIAALTRLLPHPHNFTPIGAIGLFGAAYFGSRWLAILVPLATLFLTDLFLNNVVYAHLYTGFAWITSWWIYAAFLAIILTGWAFLRGTVSPTRVVAASLTASVVFFLISNFSVWLGSPVYPQTLPGLIACYAAGLPFLGNTILGDLFFSGVLFGGYYWVTRQKWAMARG